MSLVKWILVFLTSQCWAISAITYKESKGRFADRFLGYIHAKWVSHQVGIPVLYKPFLFSDQFAFDDFEEVWTLEKERSFEKKTIYTADITIEDCALYEIPFFSDCLDDEKITHQKPIFKMDMRDQAFRSIIKQAFTLKMERPKHLFPNIENLFTIALHVRRGGGFDPKFPFLLWPLRFTPDSYYIDSIRLISSLFPDRPLYAYIFTDDLNPGKIAGTFASALSDLPIQFDCRREGNHHDLNIVEDFLAMMEFDCLIRSASNYSLIPAIAADYEVVISPTHSVSRTDSGITIIDINVDPIEKHIDKIELYLRSNNSLSRHAFAIK
jgi:hypothetical protein